MQTKKALPDLFVGYLMLAILSVVAIVLLWRGELLALLSWSVISVIVGEYAFKRFIRPKQGETQE